MTAVRNLQISHSSQCEAGSKAIEWQLWQAAECCIFESLQKRLTMRYFLFYCLFVFLFAGCKKNDSSAPQIVIKGTLLQSSSKSTYHNRYASSSLFGSSVISVKDDA